jgi:hypothetical protein
MDQLTLVVRIFEAVSFLMFLGGLVWVIRQKRPLYWGTYLGSIFSGIYFDWINNTNWFLRVAFDERFLPLFRLAGWPQPLAMSTTYAFYFGIPLLAMIHHREALAKRFGERGQYVFVGLAGMIALPLFEIPMVQAFGLWAYYQKPAFLLGGVAWTNWVYSALLFVVMYAALRFVIDAFPTSLDPNATDTDRRRGVLFSFMAYVTAFAVVQFGVMIVYALTSPWIDSPRPF